MVLVVVLLVLVLLAAGVVYLNGQDPNPKLSDQALALRSERDDLDALVARLHRMAQDNSIIDPALASMIMDEIEQYKRERRR